MTLKTQYKNYLKENPHSTLTFDLWEIYNSHNIKQALINMMKEDEDLGLYDEPKQEPNKCCGAFYGCDKCKNKQVYLDKLAEDYLLSSVERNQYGDELSFIDGYKLAQKTLYSEEEAGELVYNIIGEYGKNYGIMIDGAKLNELFEQFKKK